MALSINEHDLSRFMRSLGPQLVAVARGICRDADTADDVVQEAFVRLWNSPPDGPERVVPSWLRRVVVNLSINHLRRRKRTEPLPEFSFDPNLRHDDRPEDRLDRAEQVQRIDDAMARLPEDKRAILIMRVYQGMAYQEIAEALEIPVGTVMSRLNRARAALREALEAAETSASESGADVNGEEPMVYPFRRAAGGGNG